MTGVQGFAVLCSPDDVPGLPEPCSASFTSWDDFFQDAPLETGDVDQHGVPYTVVDGSGTDPNQFTRVGGVLSIPGVNADGGSGLWFQQLADMGGCCDGYNYAFDVALLPLGADSLSMITGFVAIGAGPDFTLSGVGVVIGVFGGVGIIIPAEDTDLAIGDLAESFRAWDGDAAQEVVEGDRVWIHVRFGDSDNWVMDLHINGALVQSYTLTEFDPPTATNYGGIMLDEGAIGIGNKAMWCEGAEAPFPGEFAAPEITSFSHEDNNASGGWTPVAGADHYRYRFCYGTEDT